MESVSRCPVCGGERLERRFPTRDRLLGQAGEFALARCASCGTGVLSPRPSAAELGGYYPDDYAPYGGTVAPGAGAPLLLRAARRAAVTAVRAAPDRAATLGAELRRGGAGGRVLDVGCGHGGELRLDAAAGWRCVGVDLSPVAVRRARGAGLDVREGDVHAPELDGERFDLVRMRHVIEHVPDPVETLARVRGLLAPGGRVHVETPNFGGPSALLFGRYWYDLDTPRHLTLFTPAGLRRAAAEAGLAVERELHEVVPQVAWASLQRRLSEVPAARRIVAGRSLRTNVFLRALLAPAWWLLARAGRGERMHLVLRDQVAVPAG